MLAAWSGAVGPEIAKNAWPARIGRDGTVHVHTADAIWAFELGHRAAEIAVRLGVPKLRFAAGAVPEHVGGTAPEPPPFVPQPSPEDEERASALAATVEDEELRDRIARAAALSLARAAADRSF